ncbi:MAG TPA: hypothetical protein VL443_18235 [Cyclobacteriaceae bacterium]|jgi:hypothetical protein|nr:hypothetical protein [Cyclobacteriaceae bacterium]
MKVSTFKAKCSTITCKLEFDAPLLSDFNYGDFLYGSIDGKTIKYYCALDCKTWKVVDIIIGEIYSANSSSNRGTVIQKIIGLIADRDDRNIYYTQDIYCPQCQSKIKSIDSNNRTGFQDYLTLTFMDFESMDQPDRKNLIHELLNKID